MRSVTIIVTESLVLVDWHVILLMMDGDDDNPMRGKLCDGDYKQMLQIWGTPASCYYQFSCAIKVLLLLLCCVSEHGKKNFDLFFEDSKQFIHLWDYDYE